MSRYVGLTLSAVGLYCQCRSEVVDMAVTSVNMYEDKQLSLTTPQSILTILAMLLRAVQVDIQ